MIAKHIPMKSIKQSDFGGLVDYITSAQGKQERVGLVAVTNCHAEQAQTAALEVMATQARNTRSVSDKTYHLVLSFAPGEHLSDDLIAQIEARVCEGLGFGEHQRVSAVHHDTDHQHLHIAINKIHPTRHTIHSPYNDHKSLGQLCDGIERDYGLVRTNHTAGKSASENRVADMERHAGIESLVSWVRRECAEQIKQAATWRDVHKTLAEHGLQLQPRGNGFVVVSGDGVIAKASTIDRSFAKRQLEARLGGFVADVSATKPLAPLGKPLVPKVGSSPPPMARGRMVPLTRLPSITIGAAKKRYDQRPLHRKTTAELHAEYKAEQARSKELVTKELAALRRQRDRAIEHVKTSAALKRATLKYADGKQTRKLLRSSVSTSTKAQIAAIRDRYAKEVAALRASAKRQSWADWLRAKATSGQAEALRALRARDIARGLAGNTLAGASPSAPPLPLAVDSITKRGTVIHKAGASTLRDDGERLGITRGAGHDALIEALRLAQQRYGNVIQVSGTDQFKDRVTVAAAAAGLPITFSDQAMEKRRAALVQQLTKDLSHGKRRKQPAARAADGAGKQRHHHGADGRERTGERGRTLGPSNASIRQPIAGGNGGRSGLAGASAGAGGVVRPASIPGKPSIGGIGREPPPASQNRLRRLSQLGVVRFANGGEVLLQGHVPGHLAEQRTQPDNGMRRDADRPGAGLTTAPLVTLLAPADRYIAERESKRKQGLDVPKHRRYTDRDDGKAAFAGIRQIGEQALALLRSNDEILVLPVEQADVQRLKRIAIGAEVSVNKGAIKKKGRTQ